MFYENKIIAPDAAFAAQANFSTAVMERLAHLRAQGDTQMWSALALETLTWDKPFQVTLEWTPPFARWFGGGRLNASVQCLDVHLGTSTADKPALIWEGEPAEGTDAAVVPLERRVITYAQLHDEVARFATALAELGLKTGDRVAIYMPLIPEAVVAILACARLGAIHSVVFGGFSSEALRDRILDARATFVITANGGFRRGGVIALKAAVDKAVSQTPSVEKVVVVDRLGQTKQGAYAHTGAHGRSGAGSTGCASPQALGVADGVRANWVEGRDVWYHDALATAEPRAAVSVDSEHPLFILYTSGTTGKPKGVVHSTAGYMLWAKLTCSWIFDLKPQDVYWCTADVGWVTGHTYVVYGPLANGASVFLYEGAPDFPSYHRTWASIAREKVSIFYTAPTAIRAHMRQGDAIVAAHDLGSLRLLGSVGEPINPEAWLWFHGAVGRSRCPIVDTWWQTETGGVMITPLAGHSPLKPGCAMRPLPGIDADVVDDAGRSVAPGQSGKLVIKSPWPSQLRTVYGDDRRYADTYWGTFSGPGGRDVDPYYFSGDGAYRDKDGCIWIIGRVDDVINVAGHRIGTMEIESSLVGHAHVAEAAVVGVPDAVKGTAIFAFVTVKNAFNSEVETPDAQAALAAQLRAHVAKDIGSFAKPERIRFTKALPKTRSGKIMRRLLRDVAVGAGTLGDTTTLEDVSVLAGLQDAPED